jgi:ubiquitin-conjugating enzyme E2 T
MQGKKRLQKEIAQLLRSPPDGVVCYPVGDSVAELEAKVQPMENTPYSLGVFKLAITCGDHYPNEPPSVRFVTPVYHPNIDSEGRICLNLLKMPPKGCWAPSFSLAAVLRGIQFLLAQPNPDDPLMTDITDEYRTDYSRFAQKAADWTRRYAMADSTSGGGGGSEGVVAAAAEKPPIVEQQQAKEATPKREQDEESTVVAHIVCEIPVKKLKLF